MPEKKIIPNESGSLVLEVSEDGFSAYLTIKDSGQMIDENEITSLLNMAGIRTGVDEAVLYNRQQKIKKELNKPFLIAFKTKPESQLEISYLFDENNCFDPYEFKSITELDNLERVQKNSPVASLLISGMVKTTTDIFGNEITPKVAEEKVVDDYLGKNVFYSEEKKQILAKKSGYPYIDEQNRINIKSQFKIEEDIEEASLDFFGDLIIKGNIINSNLKVDGDLRVNGNILNSENDGILVDGDIQFRSAENSRIICSGGITFRKEIKFCHIIAENGISGKGDSKIVGGLTQSGSNIDIATFGDDMDIPTEVEITVSPFCKERIFSLYQQLNEIEENSPDNSELIEQLTKEIKNFENKYEEKFDKYIIRKDKEFHITAVKTVFSEVSLRILNKTRKISKELNGYSFYHS